MIIASTTNEFEFLLNTMLKQHKSVKLVHARTHEEFIVTASQSGDTFSYVTNVYDGAVNFKFNINNGYLRGNAFVNRSLSISNLYFAI